VASIAHGKPAEQNAVQAGISRLADALSPTGGKQWQTVAVLPFEALDPKAAELSLDKMSSALVASRLGQRPGLLLVERTRIDDVFTELDRKTKGQVSPQGAASVGRLLGARTVVLGSVAGAGADYLLTARAVDTETGRILAAADQRVPQASLVALSEDVVEIRSRFGAAARSAAAPGWGQFYNGDTGRGVTYLGLTAAFGAAAIVSGVLGSQAETRYQDNTAATVSARADANTHYDRANIALLGLGTTWLISVIDAYVAGENAVNIDLGAAPGLAALGGRF
jgi:TolB-like protein